MCLGKNISFYEVVLYKIDIFGLGRHKFSLKILIIKILNYHLTFNYEMVWIVKLWVMVKDLSGQDELNFWS